jgi:hypothetical protein
LCIWAKRCLLCRVCVCGTAVKRCLLFSSIRRDCGPRQFLFRFTAVQDGRRAKEDGHRRMGQCPRSKSERGSERCHCHTICSRIGVRRTADGRAYYQLSLIEVKPELTVSTEILRHKATARARSIDMALSRGYNNEYCKAKIHSVRSQSTLSNRIHIGIRRQTLRTEQSVPQRNVLQLSFYTPGRQTQ